MLLFRQVRGEFAHTHTYTYTSHTPSMLQVKFFLRNNNEDIGKIEKRMLTTFLKLNGTRI